MNKALLGLVIMLIALASCKTVPKGNAAVAITGDKKPVNELLDNLNKRHHNFEWLSMKAKVDFEDDKRSENFTVNIRMRKDSIVWASITSLMGIEVARMLITKDSFEVLNKLKKTHIKKPFSALGINAPFPMTIRTLQDLLVGNYLLDTTGKKRTKIEKDHYVLEVDNDKLNAEYSIEPTDFQLVEVQMKEKGTGRKLNATLGDYKTENGHTFSNERNLNFKGEKGKLKLRVRFTKIIWDEVLSFPFYVSDKYE